MGRTRLFDKGAAVDQAVSLFWARGFHATSLDDLTRGLGIGRGSLYAAFASKESLYQAALARYRATRRDASRAAWRGDGDFRSKLRSHLSELVRTATADERRRGCMVVNAACERAPYDEATRRAFTEMAVANEATFTALIEDAVVAGEIEIDAEPSIVASYLVTFLFGLMVRTRAEVDVAAIDRSIDVALSSLRDLRVTNGVAPRG